MEVRKIANIRAVLAVAITEALTKVGMRGFKATSFFASNEKKAEVRKAA